MENKLFNSPLKTIYLKPLLVLAFLFFSALPLHADFTARLKDLVQLAGVHENTFIGYGLVVGLSGTGDRRSSSTLKSLRTFLQKQGVTLEKENISLRNTAMVMVSARTKGFLGRGDVVDVQVASVGDARSINNGLLLPTSLRAGNRTIYITATGVVSTSEDHATRGSVADGGVIERDFSESLNSRLYSRLELVFRINDFFPDYSGTVKKAVTENFENYEVRILGEKVVTLRKKDNTVFSTDEVLELLSFEIPISPMAKIIIDKKTGVVVMGSEVRINPTFISLPQLNLDLGGQGSGRNGGNFTDAGTLMQELNRLGVSTEGIAAVFSALKKSGAINAELIFQ